MEYEYINDPITGLAKATFSLEHEIIGPWLEVEVGKNTEKLTSILTAIDQVESTPNQEIIISGHEYTATVSRDDVIIEVNASMNGADIAIPEELAEDIDGCELNTSASCGIDDFRLALLSWARFISK